MKTLATFAWVAVAFLLYGILRLLGAKELPEPDLD
jgi:hypothetical protein